MYHATCTGTPQPVMSLTSTTLHAFSISWSVPSTEGVTSYTVFWSRATAGMGSSVSLSAISNINYTIGSLLSNTAYFVVVQANGRLGSINSTVETYYTAPEGQCMHVSVAM